MAKLTARDIDPAEFYLVPGEMLIDFMDPLKGLKETIGETTINRLPNGDIAFGLASLQKVRIAVNGRRTWAMMVVIPVEPGPGPAPAP